MSEEERFWFERPADLLRLPTPRRANASLYNDATKLVIIAAIVLAVLKVSYWVVVLVVGLLLVAFAYYNGHPPPRWAGDLSYGECKAAVAQEETTAMYEGEDDFLSSRGPQHQPRKVSVVSRASVEPFSRPHLQPKLEAPRSNARLDEAARATALRAWASGTTFIGPSGDEVRVVKDKTEEDCQLYRIRGISSPSGAPLVSKGKHLKATADEPKNAPEHFRHLQDYYESLEDDRAHVEYELALEEEAMPNV
jgi:hypothetical protein